jgi:beta-aspartyl-peptidase (threonine type)
MELAGLSLADAAARVILQELPAIRGEGGGIAIDRSGAITMPFNSGGMACAAHHVDGRLEVYGLLRA